jgi:REP-associated tyrosine transposase
MFHVTTHGVDATRICRTDEDYQRFLRVCEMAFGRTRLRCHALCMMGNHYHAFVETADGALANAMELLNGRYAFLFNREHGRRGHLFRARYAATLIETEAHLLETLRYIPLNPVRAGACPTPEAWPWGTYRATLGLEAAPSFLATDWVLGLFGGGSFSARLAFREFVHGGLAVDRSERADTGASHRGRPLRTMSRA